MLKKIALLVLVVFVAIQFVRPEKNSALPVVENDISKTYAIPERVHQLLIKKCYDCHSNNTTYPAYFNIQPVGWWMARHVNEGKDELNFSVFATYPEKKALHKLEELGEVVNDGSMPLKSYTWLHPETKIDAEDKAAINAWLTSLSVEIKP